MASKTKQAEVAFSPAQKMSGKKLGANFILTIKEENKDTITLSRKVTMEEGAKLYKEIETFNKKASEKRFKDIIKLITPEAVKKAQTVENTKAAVKGIKQQVKKQVKAKGKNGDVQEEKNFLTLMEDFLKSEESPEVAVEKIDAVLAKFRKTPVKEQVQQAAAKVEEKKTAPQSGYYGGREGGFGRRY